MFVGENKVKSIIEYYQSQLSSLYPEEEINSILYIVFDHLKNWSKIDVRMNVESGLSESELLQFHRILKRLKKGEPIQYIIGKTEFYGLPFMVNENVLIPRQETEELVDLILKENTGTLSIVDIGTGSGCIPISLKKNNPGYNLFAIDISPLALETANKNAQLNEVDVKFILSDILAIGDLNEIIEDDLDVIVSNPPYIPEKEKNLMHTNVLEHEPDLALFVEDEQPLVFYEKIGRLAYSKLRLGGKLYFEINEHFGNDVVDFLKEVGFLDICIVKDLQNKDRIVVAIR